MQPPTSSDLPTVLSGCPEGLQHVEHTVVAPGALHVAHSEAPGVTVFIETDRGTFDGPLDGRYAQRLVIGWDGESLTWAWHWASSGESPVEQSRAVVRSVHGT